MIKYNHKEENWKIGIGLFVFTIFTVAIVISDYLQYIFSLNYHIAVGGGTAGCWNSSRILGIKK